MTFALRGSLATAALLAALGTAGSASGRDETRGFLAATFGLTASDFAKIDAGEVLARGTAAGDARDIATFGIVRVRITPAFYVERLADITSFKKDDAVLQIGVFGRPPALADVQALSLDEPDMRSLSAGSATAACSCPQRPSTGSAQKLTGLAPTPGNAPTA